MFQAGCSYAQLSVVFPLAKTAEPPPLARGGRGLENPTLPRTFTGQFYL